MSRTTRLTLTLLAWGAIVPTAPAQDATAPLAGPVSPRYRNEVLFPPRAPQTRTAYRPARLDYQDSTASSPENLPDGPEFVPVRPSPRHAQDAGAAAAGDPGDYQSPMPPGSLVRHPSAYARQPANDTFGFRNPGHVGRYAEFYPPGDQFQNGGAGVPVARFDEGPPSSTRAYQLRSQQVGIARAGMLYNHIDRYARPYGFGFGFGFGGLGMGFR